MQKAILRTTMIVSCLLFLPISMFCFAKKYITNEYIPYLQTLAYTPSLMNISIVLIIIKMSHLIFRSSIVYFAYLLRGRPIIIGVEGLIGAGKTTFIKGLQETGLCVIEEPVDIWRDMSIGLKNNELSIPTSLSTTNNKTINTLDTIPEADRNIMQCYNNNPIKYAYTFQSIVFITKVYNIIKSIDHNKS